MSVAQRLDPFVHGGSLTLVALLPYRPVVALARHLAGGTATPRATVAARHQARGADLRGDWDPAAALADLQRPCLGA